MSKLVRKHVCLKNKKRENRFENVFVLLMSTLQGEYEEIL